ncbi:hypothetical protein IAG41_18110 [Sphingomonas sp. JC676]|uniref:hypothetical protein n=1 Tax=Sphingomonas sp. JC676 TaxID=2768065 RepID=UPI0016585CC3|nr:hypothetical protein [Sphingomonas sp. JC676]MBC9034307.1 hypothetical protein [Sphingomonas sp. JC676]
MIHDTTDLIFFGLVGLPIMLAFALMPFETVKRYHNTRGWAVPSYRTVVIVRTMAVIIAGETAISALRYLTGL